MPLGMTPRSPSRQDCTRAKSPGNHTGRRAQRGSAAAGLPAPEPAAAAAAAAARPVQTSRTEASLGELIRGAQSQAASRRRPVSAQEMNELIRSAQMRNIPSAQAVAMAAPKWSAPTEGRRQQRGLVGLTGPQDFLGNWVDMQGNSVLVYSTDAWELRLLAAMSRPPRPDLCLSIRWAPSGGWLCGNYTLDPSASSAEQLHWLSQDGRSSVWTRGRQ
mmetsp:Transcript_87436/g.270725  ORF Transcript_87436/g.270725 Transcript_87436/m.270725 type:complete len:217 (+) Transcript_87436:230-880(+)